MRLGLFLIFRMWRDGHDNRFNHVKDNPVLFFTFWTVEGTHIEYIGVVRIRHSSSLSLTHQGLWVWLTLLPTLIVNSKLVDVELCGRDYVGWSLWSAGMVIECVADYQKFVFRGDPANKYVCVYS